MICVKSIELIEIDRDELMIQMRQQGCGPHGTYFPIVDADAEPVSMECATELIRGERFRNSDGLDVVIGWSDEVQTALKVPFRAFEDMNREIGLQARTIGAMADENAAQRDVINAYRYMTPWQRIKAVFTGHVN